MVVGEGVHLERASGKPWGLGRWQDEGKGSPVWELPFLIGGVVAGSGSAAEARHWGLLGREALGVVRRHVGRLPSTYILHFG